MLENFMGFTGTFGFHGGRNVLIGQNGSGKTRIANAVYFGLYGKSADGKMPGDFEIKSIQDGETVHDVNYSVYQEWLIDGEPLVIERIYKEKWTKSRGKTEHELTGHEVDYRINGDAKTTKRQFDEKIESVFGNRFRLCSDLTALHEIPWESKKANVVNLRREILTDMIGGESSKDEIIDSIAGFREALNGRTPEQARKNEDERQSEINKEIKEIPFSIKERIRQIDELTEQNCSEAEALKAYDNAQALKQGAETAIAKWKAGNTGNIEKIRDINQKLEKAESEFGDQKRAARIEWNQTQNGIEDLSKQVERDRRDLQRLETQIEGLRQDWSEINSESFTGSDNCPTCGQMLPEEMRSEALEKFNISKSNRLEENQKSGKALAAKIKATTAEIEQKQADIAELQKAEKPEIIEQSENDEIKKLKYLLEKLREEKSPEVPEDLNAELTAATEALNAAQRVKLAFETLANTQARIDELKNRKNELSTLNNKVVKFVSMHEQYMQAVAELTEGPINERFNYVRFRMFDKQVNGALIPTCDIMSKDSKPLAGALSTGEGMTGGIDICSTFQNHHGLSAPIIIDNASELTIIPNFLDCQTIELHHARHEPVIAPAYAMHTGLKTYISEATFKNLSAEDQQNYKIL